MNTKLTTFAQLKVGLLVFGALVIFLFFVIMVGTKDNLFGSNYDIKMFVANSEGLVEGSLVSVGGLKVGQVKRMQFVERDGRNGIDVILHISSDHQKLITASSKASIKTVGMLGDRFIDISIGSESDPVLKENQYITIQPTFNLENAGIQAEQTLKTLNSVLADVKVISSDLADGQGSIGRLLRDPVFADQLENVMNRLDRLSKGIDQGQGSLGKLMTDSELYDELFATATNLNKISSNIIAGKGSIGKLYTQDSLYHNFKSASAELDVLLAKANSDSSAVGQLLNNGELYRQVRSTMGNLDLLVQDIKENPDRYVNVSVF